jgi:hypothetical protein
MTRNQVLRMIELPLSLSVIIGINSVPSVAFVPRITTSPSEGAPMNEPTATTPIASYYKKYVYWY